MRSFLNIILLSLGLVLSLFGAYGVAAALFGGFSAAAHIGPLWVVVSCGLLGIGITVLVSMYGVVNRVVAVPSIAIVGVFLLSMFGAFSLPVKEQSTFPYLVSDLVIDKNQLKHLDVTSGNLSQELLFEAHDESAYFDFTISENSLYRISLTDFPKGQRSSMVSLHKMLDAESTNQTAISIKYLDTIYGGYQYLSPGRYVLRVSTYSGYTQNSFQRLWRSSYKSSFRGFLVMRKISPGTPGRMPAPIGPSGTILRAQQVAKEPSGLLWYTLDLSPLRDEQTCVVIEANAEEYPYPTLKLFVRDDHGKLGDQIEENNTVGDNFDFLFLLTAQEARLAFDESFSAGIVLDDTDVRRHFDAAEGEAMAAFLALGTSVRDEQMVADLGVHFVPRLEDGRCRRPENLLFKTPYVSEN